MMLNWFWTTVALVRVVAGLWFLYSAATLLFKLAIVAVPASYGGVHFTRILAAFGIVAVGTYLLDGRGK